MEIRLDLFAQPRQRRAGKLRDALQEVGAHTALEALGIGRRQHQHAEGRPDAVDGTLAQRDQGQRHRHGRIVQPVDGLEAGVHPAVRLGQRGREGLRVLAHALDERLRRVAGVHVPDLDGDLGHDELVADFSRDGLRQGACRLHLEQLAGPAKQPVRNDHVLVAVAHQVHEAVLQRLDLFPQHLGLALLQAHRPIAVRAGELHRRQQLRVAREEVRRIRQVVGDIVFGDRVHAIGFHSSISPSNTVTAGPVISTGASPSGPTPAHSIVNTPPRVSTSTLASSRPARIPATTAAQAPVPHASVSPTPRSHTRSRTRERLSTCMKPALTRLGKRGWFSISGPCVRTGARSASGTSCTACGLPIDMIATEMIAESALVPSARCHFCHRPSACGDKPAASNGIASGSNTGAPMSTVTRPSGFSRGSITPDSVRTLTLSPAARPFSCTKRMKQRAPLPHCSTCPPSALWITYSKSIPGAGEGRTDSTWSAPTPKCRSASIRYWAGLRFNGPRVSSSTTKSLPAPCILVKRIRMGAIIRAPPGPDRGRNRP